LCGQRREPSQVLSDGGQNKLILGTSRAAQSEPTELQDALQVCEPHFDLFALMPRPLEALGSSERPGNVSGMCGSHHCLGRDPFASGPEILRQLL
jgi:hypothetical protein